MTNTSPARRRFLIGLLASVSLLPLVGRLRFDEGGFVERDGWILRRSDLS
ncbi:hypothetical protein [Mangrovicella endophytica]|nr:hypothetical protein [Mangrovicella endophytica]